jgi:hypothetical protein
MFLRWLRIAFLFCVALHLLWEAGLAQEPVGRIRTIADVSGKKPRKLKKETDRVRIRRKSSGRWLKAAPDTSLLWRDRLLLQKYTRAAIDIRRKDQRGRVYLLPDSLATRRERAVYEIREHPQELGRVDLYIAHGSMIVDWAYGKLSVIALGIQTLFVSTRVAFIVDSTRAEGLVYLDRGGAIFPDFADLQFRPTDVYRLRPGQPPEKVILPALQVTQWQRFVQVNSHDLWAGLRPWWQKPAFYLPAAAAVTGGVVGGIIINGEERVSGQVVIKIPEQ